MNAAHTPLQTTLKQARQARRLSQLELSLRVGVSQRHLSFVESGRAKPSRALLMAWLQELDAPLALRNAALLQAGFAPAFGAEPLSDPTMAHANEAITALLSSHEPLPALVIDAQWNMLRLNQGARWLAQSLMPWTASLFENTPNVTPLNMLDLLVHPDGLASCMLNLSEVGPVLLAHLRDEASLLPILTPKVDAFAAFLKERTGVHKVPFPASRFTAPVLTTRFRCGDAELSFFSMFTTFGSPQNITLSSLRLEHMFAADEATAALWKTQTRRLV